MNFYSEFGEDRWIAENLPLPAAGYYVDVGCAHPTNGSNTAFLRDRGWRGLAIDANPEFAAHWAPWPDTFVQGIVSSDPFVTFEFNEARCYESRVAPGPVRYGTVSLERLCFGHPRIDLLTLDVEGHEFSALRSLNEFIEIPLGYPPIIISEYNTAGLGEDMRVRDHLFEHGYRLVHTTTANHIFHRA